MRELTAEHLLTVSASQERALDAAASDVQIDDGALYASENQEKVISRIREAAGGAFDDLVAEVRHRLSTPTGFLVVRGLPATRGSAMLVAVSAALGELVEPYRRRWSKMIRPIVPARELRKNGRVLNDFLHTDGTDWAQPNDYTCLFCVRPDSGGQGRSRLLNLDALLNDPSPRMRRLLDEMAGLSLPWRLADELGGTVHRAPAVDADRSQIRWLRYTVDQALAEHPTALSPETARLLLDFEVELEVCAGTVETLLRKGDLLIVDNKRCLHARTPIADPQASDRELHRTKVVRR
jgi:Taurine catabolism dioxygenase TauD, TfdA family